MNDDTISYFGGGTDDPAEAWLARTADVCSSQQTVPNCKITKAAKLITNATSVNLYSCPKLILHPVQRPGLK